MRVERITIWGCISGLIWWPCDRAERSFKVVYSPPAIARYRPFTSEWTGLRDAVCDITNDGDFRSATIDHAFIETIYVDDDGVKKTKTKELKPGKLIEDCFTK